MKTSAAFRVPGLPATLVIGVLSIATIPATAQVGAAPLGAHNGALGGSAALGAMTHPLGGFSNGFVPGYSNGRFGVGSRGFNNNGARGNRRGPVGYPYSYSIWVPDYFDYVDQMSQSYAAPYAYGAPIAPQAPTTPSQPVIINQYFSGSGPASAQAAVPEPSVSSNPTPAITTASNAAAGGPIGDPQNYYLIAFKDHAVFPALAYWIEDKTLHYVTMQNTHNQASIDLIDQDLTKKLNQDRNISFSLNGQ